MAIPQPRLILASGSPYRRELLARLGAEFAVIPADADERRQPDEPPAALAARLAHAKATAVAASRPDAVIIGSDQVAALGDRVLGKPGDRTNAAKQLAACSGATVTFYTAVCLLHPNGSGKAEHTDITRVQFRDLDAAEIDAYLTLDEPWDCAGSFRAEAHGVLLFHAIENQDPTALIGLPLIWLGNALRQTGVKLL